MCTYWGGSWMINTCLFRSNCYPFPRTFTCLLSYSVQLQLLLPCWLLFVLCVVLVLGGFFCFVFCFTSYFFRCFYVAIVLPILEHLERRLLLNNRIMNKDLRGLSVHCHLNGNTSWSTSGTETLDCNEKVFATSSGLWVIFYSFSENHNFNGLYYLSNKYRKVL